MPRPKLVLMELPLVVAMDCDDKDARATEPVRCALCKLDASGSGGHGWVRITETDAYGVVERQRWLCIPCALGMMEQISHKLAKWIGAL